jgi:hypothetical protein
VAVRAVAGRRAGEIISPLRIPWQMPITCSLRARMASTFWDGKRGFKGTVV